MSDKQSHVTPFLSTTKKKTNLPGFRGLVKKTKTTRRRGRTENSKVFVNPNPKKMTELDMSNKQSSIPPFFQRRRRRPTYKAFEVLRRRKLKRDGDTETIPNSLSHTNAKKQNIHSLSLNHWRRPTRFWIFKKMKTTQRWMGAHTERERERERERYRIRLRGHWRSRSPWLLRQQVSQQTQIKD